MEYISTIKPGQLYFKNAGSFGRDEKIGPVTCLKYVQMGCLTH